MLAYLFERQAELLHDENEAQPPDIAAQEAPLVTAGTVRLEKTFILVKAYRRGGETGPARKVADGEQIVRIHRFL